MTLSLKAQSLGSALGNLNGSAENLSKRLGRLNTGQIFDEGPTSTQISNTLRSDAQLKAVSISNVNTGVSILNQAKEGLAALENILSELSVLATKAENASEHSERGKYYQESIQLVQQFNTIVRESEENGYALFQEDSEAVSVRPGETTVDFILGSELERTVGSGDFVADGIAGFSGGVALEVGDMNGDGNLDLINVESGSPTGAVQFGDGNGNFSSSATYTVGANITSLDVVDGDGDGVLDYVGGDAAGNLHVIVNDGTGSPALTITSNIDAGSIEELQMADMNGDGHLDAVYVHAGTLKIADGDGTGNFSAGVAVSGNAHGVFDIGDLNNDGNLDIISGGATALDSTHFYLNDGVGTFTSTLSAPLGVLADVAIADIVVDGFDDVVLATEAGVIYSGLSDGNGGLTIFNPLAMNGTNIAIADVDGNGMRDIITATDSEIDIFYIAQGEESDIVDGAVTFASKVHNDMVIGDFDNNGALDFIFDSTVSAGVRTIMHDAAQTTELPYVVLTDVTEDHGAVISAAQQRVSNEQSNVESKLSRFESTINELQSSQVALEAGAGRSLDINQANELAKYIKEQVFLDERTAILAQANVSRESLLDLL